jgi:hypothetical protein
LVLPAETELPINFEEPTRTIKNGKSLGPDKIPAEAVEADNYTAVNILHNLFSKTWREEKITAKWKEGIILSC